MNDKTKKLYRMTTKETRQKVKDYANKLVLHSVSNREVVVCDDCGCNTIKTYDGHWCKMCHREI